MSYTPPNSSSVNFDFLGVYVAPAGLSVQFDLGVEPSVTSGIISATTDDSAGAFVGFNEPVGFFSATTDDAVGLFLVNNPIVYRGILSSTTDDATGSFSNAIVKTIPHVSTGIMFGVAKSAAIIDTKIVGLKSSISASSTMQSVTESTNNVIDSLSVVAQQCDVVRHYSNAITQDCHLAQHRFSTALFKEPPTQYRYTPTTTFDFGITLNSRPFSDNEKIHFNHQTPVHFDLIESNHTGGNNFNLIDEFEFVIAPNRTIFDNTSIYTSEPIFFAAWANDNLLFNYSTERAGLRVISHVVAEEANNIEARYASDCVDSIPYEKTYITTLSKSKPFEETVIVSARTAKPIERVALTKITVSIPRIRQLIERDQKARPIWNTPAHLIGEIVDIPRPPPYIPPDHVTVTIPTKQVYQMQHTITVTLEDLTPIQVDGVKLSLDNNSFAWSFSANLLDLTQLDLVKQPTNAPPVTLVITIDGTQFKMLVEKITRNRSFAKNSISLSGRSLSALLSSPYEQPRSATQSSLMTVQQIAALELPVGWTLNWNCQDWNVPSGAFSYTSKTPIQVISEIAASVGAIVVPSRNAKVLTVLAHYSVLPWNFDATTPDLIIPDAAIISLSYRNIVPTQANAVYIHGSEQGGILSRCRLTGTAGDKLSATQTNALMTDVVGTRQLGEKILADNYEQPAIQSVSMSLGGDYPLVNVGVFVRINIDGGQVRGVVNSVSIDASLDKITQTIQIGNESTNVWTAFKEMLPSSPLLVGTVASVDGQTSLMTLIDGGVIRCRGVGGVAEKWYIRNGALESKAPSLTLSEIVI